jgi:hypothetical protein
MNNMKLPHGEKQASNSTRVCDEIFYVLYCYYCYYYYYHYHHHHYHRALVALLRVLLLYGEVVAVVAKVCVYVSVYYAREQRLSWLVLQGLLWKTEKKVVRVVGLAPLDSISAAPILARLNTITAWILEIPPLSGRPASRAYDRKEETMRRLRRVHVRGQTRL